ncbi:hypothetical protein CAPTEDRAFT_183425 [Capitella teleta]|uniref:Aminotransferase class I/classII large domain-containing protein n=1 Tax=Capitella teleta TaxID=283909 RepID=R7V6V5_CAPTE|nr:hypothetical protein CAPTEDRAFT_183425 [Capitella teleta]|eukprot:ELU14294.1 hypothetical protein CAPTEDRAFT_183425 [Capitella teleta]
MYRLTNNDGSEALQSACEMYERAASLFGMSKTFGLPGLRIGWVCSRDEELVNMMLSFKDYITICCPGPSEILAIMGLRSEQQITERVMDIVKCNLDILDAFFADYHDIFVWSRPRAGTTAFVKIQGWLWDFCERRASNLSELVAAEDGVLILPGKAFDFEDQFFRVGFGRRNLPEVVDHFRNFLNRHKPNMLGESNVLLPSILH